MSINKDTIENLKELRRRIISVCLVFTLVFIVMFLFANKLFEIYSIPLLKILPNSSKIIAIDITSTFTSPLKLALFSSCLITAPYSIFQIWKFVSPALYKNEKANLLKVTLTSIFLFYLGIIFAYCVVIPLALSFFISIAPANVEIMTSISSYINFILDMCLVFALAFQTPIITFLLIVCNVVDINKIKQKRPYIIIAAFVIGMLLTPPDVISQILLAIPLLILFEAGLLLANNIKATNEK